MEEKIDKLERILFKLKQKHRHREPRDCKKSGKKRRERMKSKSRKRRERWPVKRHASSSSREPGEPSKFRRERYTTPSDSSESDLENQENCANYNNASDSSESYSSATLSRSAPVKKKRRRIISSDDSSESENKDEVSDIPRNNLDSDLLELLGSNVAQVDAGGPEIHNSLVERWSSILIKGLSPEERNSLIGDYPIPTNCDYLNAPKLNDVVAAAISDSATRRDIRLSLLQTQVGAAVTAIGNSLTSLLKEGGEGNKVLVKQLSDAGRLLADLFHSESLSRRDLITMYLNKDIKETLDKSAITSFLFGDNLEERIKSSKNILRSSQDLKVIRPKQNLKHLNYKGLPRYSGGTLQSRPTSAYTPHRRQPQSSRQFANNKQYHTQNKHRQQQRRKSPNSIPSTSKRDNRF
ncbi:uncharacterized protein LOC126746580 [Anthonomus grandis grandis]|uniref:uncharacterized protein LOC126746580 n=1 Tax=Anthonomus grandis grandis TaxID=2921223 RepID=UPI002165A5E2|nr:uncharacterized protein LOC126746580 [Anthonomus grandis grandis]